MVPCGFLPCSTQGGLDADLTLSDGMGANILLCWDGGRHAWAMVSP